MRVFYASHDSGNGEKSSLSWYHNLYLPLIDISEQVIRFDFALQEIANRQDFTKDENKEYLTKARPILEEALLQQVKAAHKIKPLDVFFSYFASSYCGGEVIKEISKLGIVTINWFCNASYQFYLVEQIAPYFDYCLVPEKFRLEDYKRVGANPIYCQQAANPNIYKPLRLKKDIDTSFIGSRYGDRYSFIKALYNAGNQLEVFGNHWIKDKYFIKDSLRKVYHSIKGDKQISDTIFKGVLKDDEVVNIFNRSKINLGFAKCGDTYIDKEPIKQVRLRDFEVTMAGGFYLTEYCEELAAFFEPDKEIIFFNNKEELVDKAKFYLEHDTTREQISKAAYKRASEEHSWQKRLQSVFKHTGFNL